MTAPIELTVRQFIVDNFFFLEDSEPFADGDSFLARGIMDSTGILELVSFLEQTFAIRVADEEIVPDNLDSIDRIAAYLRRKLGIHASTEEKSHAR